MKKIVVNARGEEKEVAGLTNYPDKKKAHVDPSEVELVTQMVRKIKENAEVGQQEATWIPTLDKYGPMLFLFLTDPHYASIRSDHDKLNYYFDVVDQTSNMFLVTGGDDCDNFSIVLGKVASGVYENAVEPGIQAQAWAKKIQALDKKGKVGFMVFGNHTDWTYSVGIDWYETFLGGMSCPLLTTGGLVHLRVGEYVYDIAATHRYWGVSKLNPTNACKRYLEHEYPTADIILLGHTHQSEILQFDRGGKDRLAIIGGTLKSEDEYARKVGIGGRAGTPGMCISVWPDHREILGYKNFDRAVSDHLRRL